MGGQAGRSKRTAWQPPPGLDVRYVEVAVTMPAKLKVFRTPIGFYDAYVAAPSRKAALAAWGSEKNLFASGRAEQVEDAKLGRAPLAVPGRVIKVRRGTDLENIAALPETKPPRTSPARAATKPANAPPRRPSRSALDRAEQALEAAKATRAEALDEIDEQIRELRTRRREQARRHDEAVDRLRVARDEKADAYDAAMDGWRAE